MVLAEDSDYVSGKICTIKETTEAVLVASRDIYLEANTEKTQYVLIPYEQSARRHHNLKMADK